MSIDVIIVGAGPAGLFAAFQLGLHGFTSLLIDSHTEVGGQCAVLYADKPIYDMPGYQAIEAGELVRRLFDQVARFQPKFRLGDGVVSIQQSSNGGFVIKSLMDHSFAANFVVLATGLGPFGQKSDLLLPDGVHVVNRQIAVDTARFESPIAGLFAIGDAAKYDGKLPLLVSAFHEAALMAFTIRTMRAGGKRVPLEYSSTSSALKNIFS